MSAQSAAAPGIPEPVAGDAADVRWALEEALAQWEQGGYRDAVEWLRRAAEAAVDAGHLDRAVTINRAAERIRLSDPPPLAASGIHWDDDDAPALAAGHVPLEPAAGRSRLEDLAPRDQQDSDDGADPIDLDVAYHPTTHDEPAVREALLREATGNVRGPSQPPARRSPFAAFRQRAAERASGAPPKLPSRPPSAAPAPRVAAAPLVPMGAIPEDVDLVAEAPDVEYRQSFLPDEMAAMLADQPRPFASSLPEIVIGSPSPADLAEPGRPPPRPQSAPRLQPPPKSRSASKPLDLHGSRPVSGTDSAAGGEVSSPVSVGGVRLGQVPGLENLPDEAQSEFSRRAHLATLGVGEEIGDFAVALVVRGWVDIMPKIADYSCARARAGDVVFTDGTLDESVPLRVVAGEDPTLVAVWDAAALQTATRDCPWVDEELRSVADRFQALAGASMGDLGDRIDDTLRFRITDQCRLRALLPHEVLLEEGSTVDGLYVVGAGRIELVTGSGPSVEILDELGAGDLVFADAALGPDVAPHGARAGARGALILHASRPDVSQLVAGIPELAGLLFG